MMGASYKTKKDLKASIGQPLRYEGLDVLSFQTLGRSRWLVRVSTSAGGVATVTLKDGLIVKVA